MVVVSLLLASSGCSDAEVIAHGDYFELATDRDDPLCAGTSARIDAYMEEVAALLGEELPRERFLRIEWRDVASEDGVITHHSVRDDVIVSADPFDTHELVHAVHLEVWPRSHRLLEEGLATMLGSRGGLGPDPWPDGTAIESVLGPWSDEQYPAALFIVSQIVSDHGFEGLRTLWHSLTPESGADQFRAEYERQFERSLESLVEPVLIGPVPNRRFSCFYEICLDPAMPIDTLDGWSAQGPGSCDDEHALGPRPWGEDLVVWTQQTVEVGTEPPQLSSFGGVTAVVRYCGLGCNTVPHHQVIPPGTMETTQLSPGLHLVEVGQRLSELPTSGPATVRLTVPP